MALACKCPGNIGDIDILASTVDPARLRQGGRMLAHDCNSLHPSLQKAVQAQYELPQFVFLLIYDPRASSLQNTCPFRIGAVLCLEAQSVPPRIASLAIAGPIPVCICELRRARLKP